MGGRCRERNRGRPPVALLFAALVVGGVACNDTMPDRSADSPSGATSDREHAGDGSYHARRFDSPSELDARFQGDSTILRPPESTRQLSIAFEADGSAEIAARAHRADDSVGPWQTATVTWREDDARVAHVIFTEPVDRVELRRSGGVESLYVEFSPRVTARTDARTDRAPSPAASPDDSRHRTARQLEAPESLVVPREKWGARNPDKLCGRKHSPHRMTVHHTAVPADDGGDPAKRMRQIQAFHIDNRGWCDIGYHFVVSQSGRIFQGRSTEKRTGAHVGGENDENIGIAHIGDFRKQSVGRKQFRASARILHWLHDTYDIPLDRDHVKGHREWPGQSTTCPGDNLLTRLEELLRKSDNPGSLESPWKVDIETNVLDGTDLYKQGTSDGVPDAFAGDELRAEIVVTNDSDRSLEKVAVGYSVDTPHLVPVDYTIQSDPGIDGEDSWQPDEANSSDANPESLDSDGRITFGDMLVGESKRLLVTLRAERYGLGTTAHPGLRGWIRTIGGVYETKTSWDGTASTNRVGDDLRAAAQLDVPSRNEWRFDATDDRNNLEGWSACCDADYDRFALNTKVGALALEVTGSNPRLRSPSWTRVDADRYETLLIRMRSHDGAHPVAIRWKRDGESYSDSPRFRFRVPGDGAFHTYAVPLDRFSEWSGTVTGLQVEPLDRDTPPESGATGWYDIDGMYFRNSEGERTTERRSFANPTRVAPLDPPEDDASADEGAERDSTDEASDAGGNGKEGTSARATPLGCNLTGRSGTPPIGLVIAILTLGLWRRTRRASSSQRAR